jgi:gluconate kinase
LRLLPDDEWHAGLLLQLLIAASALYSNEKTILVAQVARMVFLYLNVSQRWFNRRPASR